MVFFPNDFLIFNTASCMRRSLARTFLLAVQGVVVGEEVELFGLADGYGILGYDVAGSDVDAPDEQTGIYNTVEQAYRGIDDDSRGGSGAGELDASACRLGRDFAVVVERHFAYRRVGGLV